MMNLKLEIRRNADGVGTSQVWPNWEFNDYWWEEGNAACDCNREDFFLQAQGVDTANHDSECGDNRYSVRCSDADTGAVLYDEFETPNVEFSGRTRSAGTQGWATLWPEQEKL